MKKLLHIIATPRREESRTLKVSSSFLKAFTDSHPDWEVEEFDLAKVKLPDLAVKQVNGKYLLLSGKDLTGPFKASWKDILKYIQQFLSADGYLLSTPMWNFSIPYKLKHYLDVIVQPKYLFQYTNTGVEGLVKNKKMVVVVSRGGDYTSEPFTSRDHQEPYLRSIFGFVGISDIKFIIAQPMDMGNELQEKRIQVAQGLAKETAKNFG
ncbi:MAG: NAD(P)H-dependent oxidoreductase [Candidatus Omnitrophica bacterium]|nr:NAD(P)H-dependent oxidoreductase [Candidatus Omnitrophota bacterium]